MLRTILIIACAWTVAWLHSRSLQRGQLFAILGIASLPVWLFLVNHQQILFLLTIGSFYSWIYVPGLPTTVSLYHLLCAGAALASFASRFIRRVEYPNQSPTRKWALAYMLVVILTMLVRGGGLKILGSSTWGSGMYIQLVIAIGFYLLSDWIIIPKHFWKAVLIAYFCAGLIPSAAELVFLLTRGHLSFLYTFIRPEGASASSNLNVMTGGVGVLRFQVSKYIAMIFPLCLALFPYQGKNKRHIIFSGLVALIFAGLSGHRSAIIYIMLLIPVFMRLNKQRLAIRILIIYGVMAFFTVIGLHLFGRALPLSFQRAVSWVPFANISSIAAASATETTTWRLEVWSRVAEMIPKYMIIGRGFSFDPTQLYSYAARRNINVEWALISHNYHNGPLSLLVDLGIPGLISGIAIYTSAIRYHLRKMRDTWVSPILARYQALLLATLIVEFFRFIVIHGGPGSSIMSTLVIVTIMDGLWRTNIAERNAIEKAMANQSPEQE